MAETIKIEIPVSVIDSTDPNLSNITKKMKSLSNAAAKVNKIMMGGTQKKTGIEKSMEKMEKTLGSRHVIEVAADDSATPVLSRVEDAVSRVDGISAEVDIGADNNATQEISYVEDAAAGLDGVSADVELGADNNATPEIMGVEDAASRVDGKSSELELGANDNASPVIDGVMDKASQFAGKTYSATLSMNGLTNSAGTGVVNTGHGAAATASSIKSEVAGIAGAAGMSIGLVDAVDNFKDFQSQMSEVKAISGATEEEFSALTAKAKQMGADTKYSAVESAQAFSYMAMAGWNSGEMIDGIAGVMNLAVASGENLASTSDIVTDALTAFGLQAKDSNHFADVLAKTSASANTNVGLMGESFKHVAPLAGAMNYSIEDTALALGIMANAGVKGSMAGTALRSSLANLASPTDQMAEAMKKYNISLVDEEGNMKSLKGVMDDMRTSLGGLSETEQTAAATEIFGKEAMAGMLAIVNASEGDYRSLAEAISNADGAAESMAETMMDNLAGSLEYLSGEMDETQNQFGERLAPYIASGARALESALPGVRQKMNRIFDGIDNRVSTMKISEAWQNADFFGKVNIAWNEIIADPFMDWIGGDGKHLISSGIGSLFSDAVKILPGGDQAGLTSWLSTAIIGKGTLSAISGISKLASTLNGVLPGLGTAAAAAGGVATAIGAIGIAIDNYNQKQINTSLEEHFGNVALSAEQIQGFVDQLIDVEFTTNVSLALGEMTGADEVRQQAEDALAANDAIEWKCSVGLVLSEEEQQTYSDNVETFITAKKSELENQFTGLTLAINTVIDEENSSSMISTVQSWLAEDQASLENLSANLTTAVESALTDGIVDVDEQAAINELQSKINNILASWNESKSQTQLDMIRQQYGHLTGADLEAGSFQEIIDRYQEQRETQQAEIDALSEEYYNAINSAQSSGRLSSGAAEQWKSDWLQGILGKQGSSLANAVSFESNTLQDTYGNEIAGNLAESSEWVTKSIENQMNTLFASGGEVNLIDFQSIFSSGVGNQMGSASGALKGLYKSMAPDVNAMGELIDRYRTEFGYVPQNIMDAYNEAIQIGAAAGDTSAAMQQYVNALLAQGSDEVVSALTDPSNPMYESIRSSSPELALALDRALSETGQVVEIDDLMARLTGLELENGEETAQMLAEAFSGAVSESGSEAFVTADGLQVKIGEVEVDGQSAIEQIASAVNMTADELAAANGYASAVEVPIGATITIPAENVSFDTSAIELVTQTQNDIDDAYAATMETEGAANVEMEQTNNSSEIYSEVTNDLQGAFATTIPVTAKASVTVDYSIANPTASISFGGGGTGATTVTASIAASANGRYVDSPMVSLIGEDGPEFVIPVGAKRRERGIELWQQAGQALGIPAYADGGLIGEVVPETDGEAKKISSESISSEISSEKGGVTVHVNVTPQFNIGETDENSVLRMIRTHMKEIADNLGAELANMLNEAYENMPVV